MTRRQLGTIGEEGDDAYEVAVAEGFVGTRDDWLASLEGDPGGPGASAYEVAVANGFVGTPGDWLDSLVGENGLSAYELAVAEGFAGTLAEWLDSLQGEPGPAASLPFIPVGGHVEISMLPPARATSIPNQVAVPDSNYYYNFNRTVMNAVAQWTEWDVHLVAGTYTVHIAHRRGANRGIATVILDGAVVGAVDLYASALQFALDPLPGVVVADGGPHVLRLQCDGKNPASSGFFGFVSAIILTRTA